MAMTLYIIRHGQPLDHEEGRIIPNSPLGKLGIRQAELAAEQIKVFGGVDYIYSSSFSRALDTAKPLYNKFKVPWYVWPALCETGRRDWPRLRKLAAEGSKLGWDYEKQVDMNNIYDDHSEYTHEAYSITSELNKMYPSIELNQPFDWPDAWWLPLRDETQEICYERGRRIIESLKDRHIVKQERVGVVCHGAFGSVLLTILAESPPSDFNRFNLAHASISCVKLYDDGSTSIVFSDFFSHLYPNNLTDY